MRQIILTVAFASLTLAAAAPAMAQPPHCPPGHAKKGWCSPGPRYDVDRHSYDRRDRDYVRRDYVVIRDYDRYGLRAPRDGYYYGVLDDEVYLISRATQEVIEGIGAVQYLLNR